ncbi:hypothetical protein [Streptomyces sp. SM11]|uniref:hypothetical protein n=1 Tax=Streptomyces sp. SM11 TaxID=565557 RepID=UPI001CA50F9E|nr:hypothetical protein [Streptomyces sp. SM11]
MTAWFAKHVVDTGRLRLFCFFTAFIGAFLFIRFSVRMIRAEVSWWPGNVTRGGTHIHHAVFGVVFGVGAALVLDDFALLLDLKDVYWSERGRLSVDAVFLAVALTGLALTGIKPLGLDRALAPRDASTGLVAWIVTATILVNLALVVLALAKGKTWSGLIGLFLPGLALVGAVRLARPRSPWARARHDEGPWKLRGRGA